MKNIVLTVLLSVLFSCSFAQSHLEHEIFYTLYEQRDTVTGEFIPSEYEVGIGTLKFELTDSSNWVVVNGDFSYWGDRGWAIISKPETKKIGENKEFNQMIFPAVDARSKNIVLVSLIIGKLKYPSLAFNENQILFECTFLYLDKRYIFVGIYSI